MFLPALLSIIFVFAGNSVQQGKLNGHVTDAETRESLIGVNIYIPETKQGAVSDEYGNFSISKIEAGIYTIRVSYVGYKELLISDVIIKSNRITNLPVALNQVSIKGEGVTVTAGFFQNSERQPVSSVSFNNEEIRRSPGSGGEISRILQALPGVASSGETSQDIFVRGGSPTEVNFYIDNIAIPSIKHFQEQNGASNGPIGLVNTELVREIEFSTGGFGAQYGYVMSGVGEISYRQANRERILGNVDMTMAGFGATFEIPDFDKKGSWLVSGRRSYLDVIADAINAGGAPSYSDIQVKYHRDLGKNDKLTFLTIFGASQFVNDEDEANETGSLQVVDVSRNQFTSGLNWQHVWGNNGYSNTSISFTNSKDNTQVTDLERDILETDMNINQQEVTLRNVNFHRFNREMNLNYGLESKYQSGNFDYAFASFINFGNEVVPPRSINQSVDGVQSAAFATFGYKPIQALTIQTGIRVNHSSFNDKVTFAPRISARYEISPRLSLHAAAGIYHQRLPLYYLSQAESIRKLDETQARHFIVGLDYMLTASTKMTVEFFDKAYTKVPVLPADSVNANPQFVPDGFGFYETLESRGKGYARGIDVLIQKKLAENFYGGINASFLRAQYTDHLGKTQNRDFDVQTLFSVIGGYRPSKYWEFSARWSFVGARPYTPAYEAASVAANSLILDLANFNSEHLPAFHSLYTRFDRRFFWKKVTFTTFMEIWNTYNRENVIGLYYNKADKKVDEGIGFTFLPVGGFKLEF